MEIFAVSFNYPESRKKNQKSDCKKMSNNVILVVDLLLFMMTHSYHVKR